VVPDPARVAGERVLVFDDVYTEGLTILEVARALRLAGAAEVSQIVLARQPWGRR
jgi:predicted amidophosphoribosyltransferase